MTFSRELYLKLTQAIDEKFGRIRPCPVCGQDDTFLLMNEVTNLPLMANATTFEQSAYTSCLVLICERCGCTHLLNVNVLGVREMITKEAQQGETQDQDAAEDAATEEDGSVTDG